MSRPSDTLPAADDDERVAAVRALEGEFGELIAHFRRVISENAERVSPGMLPGAYKVFTTIVRRESITLSSLAEILMADKGQISRSVRDLEQRGLIERAPDPADGRSLHSASAPQEDLMLAALAEWSVEDIRSLTRLLHALTAGERP